VAVTRVRRPAAVPVARGAGFRFCVGDSTVTAGNGTLDCARATVIEKEKSASRNAAPINKCAWLLPVRFRWSSASRQSALIVTSIHFHARNNT
jgi:hypothetical protein